MKFYGNCLFKSLKNRQGGSDIEYLKLKSEYFGKENRDKTIYYICENSGPLGFFAMYRNWLEYLYFADRCGYVPVIDAGRDFAYREKYPVCGTANPFEYYFCQPNGIGLKKARASYRVIQSDILHRNMIEITYTGKWNQYCYTPDYLRAMSKIVKKYIKFNTATRNYLKKGLRLLQIDKDRVLGVHIRGTDFRNGFNNHPVYVTENECFSAIDKIMEEGKYEKIFLATDDSRILEKFAAKYGETLRYYTDVMRSGRNKSVMLGKSGRKYHKYRLGLEVIRDMYTLAMCGGLVAGISQVAVCAQINKLAMGKKYDDLVIIDKGINRNAKNFLTKGK